MAVQPPDPPDQLVHSQKTYASLFTASQTPPSPGLSKPLEYFKGFPAVSFSKEEIEVLAKPYKAALVGKFEGFRPPLPELRKRMDTIGFKGSYNVSLLHPKHVLIQFAQEADYQRCWLKRSWNLGSSLMKIIPWTPNWSPEAESPIAPVWVELIGLPIHFFEKSSLHRITRHLGNFIKLDAATEKRSRPSVAKISIAMNLQQTPPDRIWIGTGEEEGFWQTISYLDKPDYCSKCSRIGHKLSDCGAHKEKAPTQNPKIANLAVWREVRRPEGLGTLNNQLTVLSPPMVLEESNQENEDHRETESMHGNVSVSVHLSSKKMEAQSKELITNESSNESHGSTHVQQKQKELHGSSESTHVQQKSVDTLAEEVQEDARRTKKEMYAQLVDVQNIHVLEQSFVPRDKHKENESGPSKEKDTTPYQFSPSKENNTAAPIQQCMESTTEKQKQKENACPTLEEAEEDARPTEKEVASPTEEETNTVTVAGMRTVAAHAGTVANHAGTVAHADTVAGHAGTVAITVANNLTIPHVQVQFMDAIDNHIASERAQEIQMEALDLAKPRQKITKGHMELRKLDINVTRIDELLQMDSIGTGVASRLRSKDDHSLVDSIAKIQSNQTPQSEDTDEDTEELSYMDERAAQWEVNIGSSRRRALQTRRKANKIAAKGNTLINKGKYHAYEVKRRGGSKI